MKQFAEARPLRAHALPQRFFDSSRLAMPLASTLLVMLGALPALCMAEGIPWRQQRFDLQASNEPLNAFLGRMLTLNGIAATMSPPIASAKVNGRLQGAAETVFRELSDTY